MVIFSNDSEINFSQGILFMLSGSPFHWNSLNSLPLSPTQS